MMPLCWKTYKRVIPIPANIPAIAPSLFNLFENIPNDTIKKGSGYYQNINLYLKNWGLSTEYKRYSFDKAHGEFTANDYGNQIEFQQMPTLVMEHNSTLLNRVTHNNNFNDERGLQIALNGNIQNFSIILLQNTLCYVSILLLK